MKKLLISVLVTGCTLILYFTNSLAQEWKPVPGQIMTSWAEKVNPQNVLNEYPRPQQVRKDWMNLNGLWDFDLAMGRNNRPVNRYTRKILVPFCVESALSGIKETVRGTQEMMYRRLFSVPGSWNGKRIILHFEGVDYYSRIWVDDKFIGEHSGGYDAFSFDITDALDASLEHNIKMVIWDPTNSGTQTVGKQTYPELLRGHRYTPSSGIYLPVWMEPVPEVSINKLKILPDLDKQTITVTTAIKGWALGYNVIVKALDNGKEVASAESKPGQAVTLTINNPKTWSPSDPFLYDLKVSLMKGSTTIDEVGSYFGMRKISMGKDAAGFTCINLNNKEILQVGPLDQGYWPEGLLTPPSDEAIKFDVEYLKKIGCNMDRVHIKVQPERFYYYCDKLGILVWQDMITPWSVLSRSEIGGASDWEAEWEKIIDQLYNHPSIVQWTVFNESWGQYDTERITAWTMRKDPSRIVTNASGWNDRNVGNIRDFHDYTFYPSVAYVPKYYDRAMVLGEAGGLDCILRDNLWLKDQQLPENINREGDIQREGYNTRSLFEERYNEFFNHVCLLKKYGLKAVVYTQISDVEWEINGWLTYDRKVSKIPEEKLAAIHKRFWDEPSKGTVRIPLSVNNPQVWSYTFTEPSKEWFRDNSGKWTSGRAPFGMPKVNIPEISTKWDSPALYLKKDFELIAIPSNLGIATYNSGIASVYINGEHAMTINSLMRQDAELKVTEVMLPPKALALLKKGKNNISVKVDFNNTEQPLYFFDLGLTEY
jgi:hypothetical protein